MQVSLGGREGRPQLAALKVVASACAFGSISILILVATGRGTSLVTLLIGRYVVALPLFYLAARREGSLRMPLRRALVLMLLLGGAQALLSMLSLSALDFIPAAMVAFLFYSYPAIVTATAAVFGIERLTGTRVAALLMSIAGIALVVGVPVQQSGSLAGIVLAVSAAVVYAAYVLGMNRVRRETPPSIALTYVATGAGTMLLVGGVVSGDITWQPDVVSVLVILGLGLISTVLAFHWFLAGLAQLGPVRTSIISTVEPFWTTLLAVSLLGQSLRVTTLLGGLLIVGSVFLLQRRGRQILVETAQPDVA